MLQSDGISGKNLGSTQAGRPGGSTQVLTQKIAKQIILPSMKKYSIARLKGVKRKMD